MANMSNRKKESIAVNAIEQETFKEGSYLVADIPTGDKAPSFDGQITVFKDDSERKESYLNDVPTQVKGTGVKKFTVGNRKFPLDITHYENYYKRGGCLLLVVEILENTNTKIFYKQLLPTELNQIITHWGHQKSLSIELRPLEETTLYSVCRKFIDQMVKQPRILIEKNQYTEEEYEKLIFTSLTFDPKKGGFQDIFNHDFVQFGLKNNIEYPIRNMRIDSLAVANIDEIEVNDKVFEVMVKTKYAPPNVTKLVEGCLELTFNENSNKLNFTIKEIKSLAAQLKILPLLIEFLKSGEIKFADFYGKISSVEATKYITDLENAYSLFLALQKLFSELNVDENIQFGNNANIDREIERIIDIMVYKNYSGFKVENPDNHSFFKYKIGDIYLIFFYTPTSETKFINAFSQEVLDMHFRMVMKDTKEEIPISPYILLEKETLMHAKNLDFNFIIQSFNSMDFKRTELFETVNNFCLVCLNSFDDTNNKEILRLPLFLLNKLKESISDPVTKQIIFINLLQTNYRQNGKLTKNEYKELMSLKNSVASSTDNIELMFCINVLLQSKREADFSFEEFDNEKKELYKPFPIFTLYEKL
ncbi:hypothetical protein ASG97_00115 [Bacillus sp. Soil745]|nr:hypothetical protein ASG97_00115 [Bacillus sp. Soil745]